MNSYLRIASLAAALLWAAPANAAILTYNYQGQPLGNLALSWTGEIIVDEALLPGGSIAWQTLNFTWGVGQPISNPSFHIFHSPPGVISARYGFVMDGYLGVDRGFFTISFNAAGLPTTWHGMNMHGWSIYDPSTNDGIDRWGDYGTSAAPGTWTVIGTPTAIPLPPALLLFGSALGLTVLTNRWRRRRVGR